MKTGELGRAAVHGGVIGWRIVNKRDKSTKPMRICVTILTELCFDAGKYLE